MSKTNSIHTTEASASVNIWAGAPRDKFIRDVIQALSQFGLQPFDLTFKGTVAGGRLTITAGNSDGCIESVDFPAGDTNARFAKRIADGFGSAVADQYRADNPAAAA